MFPEEIPAQFVSYVADILGDTNSGLSGPNIIKLTAAYAVEYEVDIPHPSYPFEAWNKRTALYENLMAFSGQQRYRIIKELCKHHSFGQELNKERKQLKIRLLTRYSHLAPDNESSEINETLIEETRHWLDDYPDALTLYNEALVKYKGQVFHRNLIDDLRLPLEKLLHTIFINEKSLENQIRFVGNYIKESGGSKELANMFEKLIDYYTKYQNSYVKHDDAVIEEEIEFIFEITSSFMKHLIRLDDVQKTNKSE